MVGAFRPPGAPGRRCRDARSARCARTQRGCSRDHCPDCKQVLIALVVTREGVPLTYEDLEGNRVDVTTVEEKDWKQIRGDVEVEICPSQDGSETYVLCRSQTRKDKDRAIVERFAQRLKKRLDSLAHRLKRAKDAPDRASHLRLAVAENESWTATTAALEGCYLLRSNVTAWSEAELWQTYVQLTDAEAAFRVQQSADVVPPTTDGGELRVRCVVKPERSHALLLERLGIELPRRLRHPKPTAAAEAM